MHPIDEIMEERCPNLMKNKILWSFIKPSIFKVFKYYDAKRIVDDISETPHIENITDNNLMIFKYKFFNFSFS